MGGFVYTVSLLGPDNELPVGPIRAGLCPEHPSVHFEMLSREEEEMHNH